MEPVTPPTVLDYYARWFGAGMIDLSASTAPEVPVTLPAGSIGLSYTPPDGLPALRAAIAEALYPGLTGEDVVVTNGASEALAAAAFALGGPGRVVTAAPGAYPSFGEVAARLGTIVRVAGALEGESDAALFNNPSVPGGALLNVDRLLRDACELGVTGVFDEVYLPLSAAPVAPAASRCDRAVSIGDLSKPLGLGGLRIGWAASRNRAVLRGISRAVQLMSGGPSALAMQVAEPVVRRLPELAAEAARRAAANERALAAVLHERGWRTAAAEAGATFMAWPPVRISAGEFARLRLAGYFLVPGEAFGLEGGVRVSRFADADALRRALDLLSPRGAETVVVLAKAPLPGVAKTRLAEALGDDATASVARAFILDTWVPAGAGGRARMLAFAPEAARALFERLLPGARLTAQCEGDLGTRIAGALAEAGAGRGPAVLVGSDTPDLPARVLDGAFSALAGRDLVIGPATDGGFYLLGSRAPLPAALLAGVEWSTEGVFEAVLANARALGLTVAVLEPWADVDDIAGLRALEARARAAGSAPHTLAALAEIAAEVRHGA